MAGTIHPNNLSYQQMSKLRKSSSSSPPFLSNASNTKSLAFQKITDSSQIQFPAQGIYYTYRPAGPDAGILERFIASLSLIYYKYLLHSGIYVMNKNERRIVNTVVIVSVFLSSYQLFQLLETIFGSEL